MGHRVSVDIDLFGLINCDDYEISEALSTLGNITTINKSKNIHIYLVNNIKVDIVNYKYKWLDKPCNKSQIKMAGIKDIAAMKLNAVSGRGTKKDFIDIYILLQRYSLSEMISFYREKYFDGSVFLVLKSLCYFEDAEENEMPIMKIQVDWDIVKQTILEATKKYSH